VTAALGSRAVLGNDMQDAIRALITGGQTDFQRGGGATSALNNRQASGSATTTTTTTVPTGETPVTNPPTTASVNQLLLDAQSEFAAADAALRQGDLASYQEHNAAARADVNQAIVTAGRASAPTTPTTKAPVTTTTGAP